MTNVPLETLVSSLSDASIPSSARRRRTSASCPIAAALCHAERLDTRQAWEGGEVRQADAIAMQRMLAVHCREQGFASRIRIGIHTSDAVRSGRGFRGSGVHQAARIAGLAGADEIVASRDC